MENKKKLKTHRLKLIFIVVIVIIIGCWFYKNNTFERKMGKWIDETCKTTNNQCVLQITDLTNFAWDKMYVFDYGYTADQIEEIIHAKPKKNNHVKRKIIFMMEDEILLYEELPTSIEHAVNNQVWFNDPYFNNHLFFTPENAIFIAKKNDYFYSLSQIKNN